MESNFNHIEKEFHKDYNSSIPDGYDWDSMKDGIQDKRAQQASEKKRRTFIRLYFSYFQRQLMELAEIIIVFVRRIYHARFIIPILLLVLIVGGICIFSGKKIIDQKTIQVLKTEAFVADVKTKTQASPQSESLEKDKNWQLGVVEIPENNTQNNPKKHTHKSIPKTVSTKTDHLVKTIFAQSIASEKNELMVFDTEDQNDNISPRTSDKNNTENRSVSENIRLKQLPLTIVFIDTSHTGIDMPSRKKSIIPPTITALNHKVKNKLISYAFSAGALAWQGKYKGNPNYLNARNDARTLLPGFHAHICKNIEHPTYGMSVGLSYQERQERFNIQVNTEVTNSYKNIIISSHTNLVSNRVSKVYGDTLITTDETRTVQHYNSYKFTGVDYSIWKKWQINEKAKIRLAIGTIAGLNIGSKGKTLGQDESIIEFDRKNNIIKVIQLAWTTGFQVNYQFNDNLSATSNMRMVKYLTNLSLEKSTALKPRVYEVGFGLEYSL